MNDAPIDQTRAHIEVMMIGAAEPFDHADRNYDGASLKLNCRRSMMADEILNLDRRHLLTASAVVALMIAMPGLAAAQANATKSKIGVIGSGHIGGTIGGLWVKAGHPVLFSSRHPEELKSLVEGMGPLAKAGTVEDALNFADVILIAVPYKAIPDLAKEYGPKFAGKIVLDPANAVARRDGEDLLAETKQKGIGVTTESYLKGSHVVRAFNSMGYTNFAKEANRSGELMAIPMAGDDAHAVEVASQLVRDAGFDPVVVPLQRAQEFAQGGPIYGQQLTAKELRERFGLAK
jgi:8-hydroxy-5-deazaflavin:NADPH oxidoreductase